MAEYLSASTLSLIWPTLFLLAHAPSNLLKLSPPGRSPLLSSTPRPLHSPTRMVWLVPSVTFLMGIDFAAHSGPVPKQGPPLSMLRSMPRWSPYLAPT